MNLLKKVYQKFRKYIIYLIFGFRNTEIKTLTSIGESSDGDTINISQEVNDQRVSKALLKGEVTQQVEELRYRTYKIDRESKQYEYFSPTLAKKRDRDDSKFVEYENAENLEVITIQYNEQNIETVENALKRVEYKDGKFMYVEPVKQYTIEINREYVTRYRLEEFLKRLVVKKIDGNFVLLDFYISEYVDDKNLISKGFITEINKIMYGKTNNDIIDISSVHFITNHAYKQNDMLEYEFNNLNFIKIIRYDGNYILKFKAKVVKNGIDLTDKYFCREMDNKYKNNEKKDLVLDFTKHVQEYTCEMCGKKIIYDTDVIDSVAPSSSITEGTVNERNGINATEYMDAQIIQQTYGKILCKDCLQKYIKELSCLK